MKSLFTILKANAATMATIVAIALLAAGATLTRERWMPHLRAILASKNVAPDEAHGDDASASGHVGHDAANSLELTQAAWKNIDLKTGTVKPTTFTKTAAVPAMVVERHGRSQVEVTALMTGVVTRVFPIEGEAIQPGQPLFELRLTHEDLVTAQTDFLRSAQELDVVKKEIARLQSAGDVIIGRRIVEQKYEKDKIQAALHAQRQGLLLHGLSDSQIDTILESRQLVQSLTISAPPFAQVSEHGDVEHLFHIQTIHVRTGAHVNAGESLGTLADHCVLYVEGQAFEDDAAKLTQAAREGWRLDVIPTSNGDARPEKLQLKVLYVAGQIDPKSRALRFYLSLDNELVRNEQKSGHQFVAWKYRPGQRMEVEIPTGEPLENQLVLPAEAVVIEGVEAYVFEQNGDHFDRVPVHVMYRDRHAVVVEYNASLVGSTLAMSGAYQMHLALKNKAGGAPDPHAGHNH